MANLDNINNYVDNLVNNQETMNMSVMSIIADRLSEISTLVPATVITLAQTKKNKQAMDLIKREIDLFVEKQIKDVKNIIYESAKSVYNETRTTLKESKSKKTLPKFADNKNIQKIVNTQQSKVSKEFLKMYKTQGFMIRDRKNPKLLIQTPMSKAYQDIIAEATQTIQRDRENYTTVMRRTTKQLIDSGIRVIEYESESGKKHTQRVDTAVRRNILDSVRDINQSVQNEVGKQIGADGVEITVHSFPAADHAPIQGHQFTNKEFEKLQNAEDFSDVDGNHFEGIQRAIGVWNCRHFTFSILVGIFPPTYTKEELQTVLDENEKGYTFKNGKHLTLYECTQYQRRLETEIRKAKEGKVIAEESGDKELAKEYQAKVVSTLNKYTQFSKDCGIKPNMKNIYVPKYKQEVK